MGRGSRKENYLAGGTRRDRHYRRLRRRSPALGTGGLSQFHQRSKSARTARNISLICAASVELAVQAGLLASFLGFVVLLPIAEQAWGGIVVRDPIARLVAKRFLLLGVGVAS